MDELFPRDALFSSIVVLALLAAVVIGAVAVIVVSLLRHEIPR